MKTDEAKQFLIKKFGHEYESYIKNKLDGDFACKLAEAFKYPHKAAIAEYEKNKELSLFEY